MERSRKLTLTNWSKANTALQKHFEGNKSELAKKRKVSRTTVTAFFKCEPVREAEFRKIAFGLYLDEKDWQVSSEKEIASNEDDWIEEVRSRCCEKILYQHGTIQLLNQAEIGVDQLYVDVWLLDRSPRTFQVSESKLLESFDLRNDRLGLGDRIQRNEGTKVANEEWKLLILGKPGAGKTTFLKHLAVDCSNGKFQPNLIPVLIELGRIRSMDWKVLDAISEELNLDSQQTQKLVERGKLLILTDGLDEVPTDSLRRYVQEQLRSFAREPKYSFNRFIITCRTQIIEVVPHGFTSVEVADFNDEQVEKFVENWFRASGQPEAKINQQWQAFVCVIQNNLALKELTATPVLLSLMCLVLQDAGELPSQAALLYRRGIRLLLEKWNSRKEIFGWEIGSEVYRKLKPEQKEALLTEIAARKFENPGNFVLFEQQDLARQIFEYLKLANIREGGAVLKAIEAQHGLLVERADELWSFSHLTLQEHFTVQWLTQLPPEQLAEKLESPQWQRTVGQLVKSQPADKLLNLIKRAIDYSISKDVKLQEALTWVESKSKIVNASYKPASIRAFYFALDLASELVFGRARDLAFARDRDLAFARDLDPNFTCDRDLPRDLARDRDLALARDLARAFPQDFALTRACDLALERTCVRDFSLVDDIESLRLPLSGIVEQNWANFQQWWKINGQAWTEKLNQVMNTHCNIGHDWQFTDLHKQALQRYFDINGFLVRLLKQSRADSDRTRQEIEDNLLLPIATLRERLPEMYGE